MPKPVPWMEVAGLSACERTRTGIFRIEEDLAMVKGTCGDGIRDSTCTISPSSFTRPTKRHRQIKSKLYHPREVAQVRRIKL